MCNIIKGTEVRDLKQANKSGRGEHQLYECKHFFSLGARKSKDNG